MTVQRYWIAAVSKEHTMRGVEGGFIQVCHGKEAPLKRMKKNDWIIVYSSKFSMGDDQKCQTFTAIGQVKDEEVYSLKCQNILFLTEELFNFTIVWTPLFCRLSNNLNLYKIRNHGDTLSGSVFLRSKKTISTLSIQK